MAGSRASARIRFQYLAVVVTIAIAITTSLGYLISLQTRSASQRIMSALAARGMDWLDASAQAEVIGRLERGDYHLVLIMTAVAIGLVLVMILYLMLLTDRIARPLEKISGYFEELAGGRIPEPAGLPMGQPLGGLEEKLMAMSTELRARTTREAVVIERFLKACRAAGVEIRETARVDLERMKRRKELALGLGNPVGKASDGA